MSDAEQKGIESIRQAARNVDNENISRLEAENKKLRKIAEKYIRKAYSLACEKGNPIIKDIIVEDANELGIHV